MDYLKTAGTLLKETFAQWGEDKAARLAAALAYYTIFALAPLVIIVLGIAGMVFGQDVVAGYLVQQIQGVIGQTGADVTNQIIESAGDRSGSDALATAIGFAVLLFGASGLFSQLQDALNTVWGVEPRPDRGVINFVRTRLVSFGVVLGIGFLLLTSLILSAVLAGLDEILTQYISSAGLLAGRVANSALAFGITVLFFALIFKILPDVKIKWNDVWVGALVTALLFALGQFLLGFYLQRTSFGSTYGAAGSLMVLLLWVYYSAQILLLGAEFTQVYARHYGTRLVPEPHARRIGPASGPRALIHHPPPPSAAQLERSAGPTLWQRVKTQLGQVKQAFSPGAILLGLLMALVMVGANIKDDR